MTWSEKQSNGAGGFFICTEKLSEGVMYYIDLSEIEGDKELLFVRKGVAVELLGSYDSLEEAKEAAQEHYSKTINVIDVI